MFLAYDKSKCIEQFNRSLSENEDFSRNYELNNNITRDGFRIRHNVRYKRFNVL